MTPWAVAALLLLAADLRAAVTTLPPLLPALGTGGVTASALTTLPVLCLALFAPCAAPLARRFGTSATVAGALATLTAGQLLRSLATAPALFAGTALAGAGIAVGNVLLPAVVKRHFPARIGPATGLAMAAMSATAALAAALAVPLEQALGVRWALALWAVPSLAAALLWHGARWPPRAHEAKWSPRGRGELRAAEESDPCAGYGEPRARERPYPAHGSEPSDARSSPRPRPPCRPAPCPAPSGLPTTKSLLREPLALAVAGFLGLVSLMFYVLTAWLPQLMRDQGHGGAEAGLMLSVFLLVGIPLGFATPVLAARLPDQRPLAAAVSAATALGLAGLLLAPQAAWLWVVLLGAANGTAFPLAVTLLSLRAADPAGAARLSGLAQTAGYGLAALGPLTVGLLHTATGSWTAPLLLLLALVLPEAALGLAAARPSVLRAHRPAVRAQSAPNGSG
ncbi:MFS transporter [Kitasatospora sp. NPDC051853]|uniref:MFS transporter n=1 Tax=Kitasatospora sp. NPDC051853 TaxID=3364058 RepID=UPI003798E42C